MPLFLNVTGDSYSTGRWNTSVRNRELEEHSGRLGGIGLCGCHPGCYRLEQ